MAINLKYILTNGSPLQTRTLTTHTNHTHTLHTVLYSGSRSLESITVKSQTAFTYVKCDHFSKIKKKPVHLVPGVIRFNYGCSVKIKTIFGTWCLLKFF